jgi:hypothetical protein
MLLPAFGGSSLSHLYSLSPDGFTSLHLPSGVLFSFHSRYYFAIGFWECLGFGVHAPGLRTEFPIRPTLCSGITLVLLLRDCHPLRCPVPRDFMFQRSGGPRPHISMASRPRIRLALFPFRSPLLRESRLISFPLPTKMLQFGRLPLADASAHKGQEVPFGNPRFIGSMRLPGVISRLGTTFIGSRTERSPIWFVATFLKSNYSI